MRYSVLRGSGDLTHVWIAKLPVGIERDWELVEGVTRFADWPAEVVCDFSDDNREGIVPGDYIDNAHNWLVVSDRFMQLLKEMEAPGVEYLPVRLRNHKGRLLHDQCWVVNVLALTEVIDRDRSEFEPEDDEPVLIDYLQDLVMREDVLESGPPVIRMAEYPDECFFREDLIEIIDREGLTGMRFVPTNEFEI